MRGRFDDARLRDAVEQTVARHESLRTTFGGAGRGLVRRVHDTVPVEPALVDLSGAEDPEAALRDAVAVELRTRIDPAEATLRVTLWRVAPDDHVLCLNMHHLVTDSWSCSIVFEDLCVAFDRATGSAVAFAEQGWQFGRYAAAQEIELTGSTLRRLQDYWRDKLAELRLPALPLAPEQAGRSGRRTALVRGELDGAVADDLRELARTEKATLFAVLLAVYYAELYRHTGDPDVAVASLFANRPRRETRRTVGFLATMVLLRTVLDPRLSFRGAVRATHETVVGGFLHQALPYQMLPTTTDGSGQRADDVVFQLLADPVYTTTAGGVEIEVMVPDGVGSRFEFELVLVPSGSGFRSLLFYDADRIDGAFARGFSAAFTATAASAAARPDASITALLAPATV